LTGEQP
jgi:hypothetical protein